MDTKSIKSLIKELDPKKKGTIRMKTYYDLLPKKDIFEEAVYDVVEKSKSKPDKPISPSDFTKLDKRGFLTYMEFKCGKTFRDYAKKLLDAGWEVQDVFDFSTEEYRTELPECDFYHKREFMEAVRKPDPWLLGEILRSSNGKMKKKGTKCPKKPYDVWCRMDEHSTGRVYYEEWCAFFKKYCSWVKRRDCERVFCHLDLKEEDCVTWKAFMKAFQRSRDFERDLEDLIDELGGRSTLKSRITGLEAWQEMDILDERKIRSRSFKDFCKEINMSRRDI